MKYSPTIFILFCVLGMVFFISPPAHIDKTMLEAKMMEGQIMDLRNTLGDKGLPEAEFNKIDAEITELSDRLEAILVEARRRQHSNWSTNLIALSLVVFGLILSVYVSWRSDVKRLRRVKEE